MMPLCVKMRKRVYISNCLYMPKKVMDGNKKPITGYLWWGWGRVCRRGSGARDRKKTFHCTDYTFRFLNHVNVLRIQKIKISIFKKPCDSIQFKRC